MRLFTFIIKNKIIIIIIKLNLNKFHIVNNIYFLYILFYYNSYFRLNRQFLKNN